MVKLDDEGVAVDGKGPGIILDSPLIGNCFLELGTWN